MNLIDYINAVFPNLGQYSYLLNKASDVVDRIIGRSIELMDIKRPRFVKRLTRLALITCFSVFRAIKAIQRFGEDTGACGFSYAPWSTEQISVCYLLRTDGIF